MANQAAALRIRHLVLEWLSQGHATILADETLELARGRWGSYAKDFSVIVASPHPMAIALIGSAGPSGALAQKSLRRLRSRISLASMLGPDVPLVAVTDAPTMGADLGAAFPEVDRVLHADQLPPLGDLGAVPVRAEIRDLLAQGAPPRADYSTELDVAAAWRGAISLDLLLRSGDFPAESLGAELHSALARQQDVNLAKGQPEQEVGPPLESEHAPVALSKPLQSTIRSLLARYLARRCGLKFGDVRLKSGFRGSLEAELATVVRPGTVASLSVLLTSPESLCRRVGELASRAWMMRGLNPGFEIRPILVLGFLRGHGRQLRGWSASLPDLEAINDLEGAGWKVLPIDWHKPVTALETHLLALRKAK